MAKRFIWFVCNYWTWTILWKCVRITIESIELRMNMEKKKPKKLNGKNSKISHIWFWNLYSFQYLLLFLFGFLFLYNHLLDRHHLCRFIIIVQSRLQNVIFSSMCGSINAHGRHSGYSPEWGANVTQEFKKKYPLNGNRKECNKNIMNI